MGKKKFYKDVWFWLFIVAIVVAGLLLHDSLTYSNENDSLNSKNSKLVKENKQYKQLFSTLSGDSSSSETSSKSEKQPTYGLNEESVLAENGTDKMYGIKITQADQTFNDHGQGLVGETEMGAGMNLSKDNGLQITAEYKNYGLSEPFLARTQYFTIYDDDGNTAEMLQQQDGQDEVTEGHTGSTHFWVNLKKPVSQTKYVEIEYKDSDIGGISKFKINLQ